MSLTCPVHARPVARRGREGCAAGERGLTLVEMLVVLAVIGVMAGATVLGIGAATRAPSTESEARRLATTIQSAADSAMVTDQSVALDWDSDGYAVAGQARHDLPAGMQLAVSGTTKRAVLGVDGTGLPLTATIGTRADRWTIAYDGLRATALRMPAT